MHFFTHSKLEPDDIILLEADLDLRETLFFFNVAQNNLLSEKKKLYIFFTVPSFQFGGMTKAEVTKVKVECDSILSCDATLVAKAEDVLYNVRVAVVGIGLTHSGKSGKPISTRTLSARLLVRNNKQDLINDRFKEISCTLKTFSDLVQLDTLASIIYLCRLLFFFC